MALGLGRRGRADRPARPGGHRRAGRRDRATLLVLPSVFALVMGRVGRESASVDPFDPESSHFVREARDQHLTPAGPRGRGRSADRSRRRVRRRREPRRGGPVRSDPGPTAITTEIQAGRTVRIPSPRAMAALALLGPIALPTAGCSRAAETVTARAATADPRPSTRVDDRQARAGDVRRTTERARARSRRARPPPSAPRSPATSELRRRHRRPGQEGPGPRGARGAGGGGRAQAEAGVDRAGGGRPQAGRGRRGVAEAGVASAEAKVTEEPGRHPPDRGRRRPLAGGVRPRSSSWSASGPSPAACSTRPAASSTSAQAARATRPRPRSSRPRPPVPRPRPSSTRPAPTSSRPPPASTSPAAEARRVEAMLGYAKILAPFDGIVTQREHRHRPPHGPGVRSGAALRRRPLRRRHHRSSASPRPTPRSSTPATRPRSASKPSRAGRSRVQVTRTSWALDTARGPSAPRSTSRTRTTLLRPGLYAYATIIAEEHTDVLTRADDRDRRRRARNRSA